MKHVHVFNHHDYHETLHQQMGKGMPVFNGYRQKGAGLGSILSFLGKYALPLLTKYVLPHATNAIKGTVTDLMDGKNLKSAMKINAGRMVKNVIRNAVDPQQGAGFGAKRVTIKRLPSVPCSTHNKKIVKVAPQKVKKKRKIISKRDIFG